ncbi:rhomboid family intramembrane serine protease [Elongatibacter sediminis]|uniref:Rhomboid family intramembrane serine protease n=1 Tax=Elongatibacter sediminis TaxID=3119006 RepID=A0AAW9RDF6_9GAMM
MPLHQPDPDFIRSRRAQANFSLALRVSLAFVALLWAILLADGLFGLDLYRFGLRPGRVSGLVGIVTAPLLHGGAGHLFNNSIPLVVATTAILYLYPNSALRAIPLIWLGSGLLGWFIGRPSLHFGASGLLYGLLAFVFVGGVLRRDMRSVSVSMLVGFLYGAMIWGVFPIRPNMSWELHLTGAMMGVLLAFVFRRWDRVPVKRYDWEDDDSVPEWYPENDTDALDAPRRERDREE